MKVMNLTGMSVLGTCGICRGPVAIPQNYTGQFDVPTCQSCGATKRLPYGPVLDMDLAARDAEGDKGNG